MSETVLCICAIGLFIAVMVYVVKKKDNKTLATIPEEFKYVYIDLSGFIAIDPRNKQMLLSQAGISEMYDFADIQSHERTAHKVRARRGRSKKATTVDCLLLRVNDPENPMWEFFGVGGEDEMDCVYLLVSRALDGTLPDTNKRRVFDGMNTEEFKALLSIGTEAK